MSRTSEENAYDEMRLEEIQAAALKQIEAEPHLFAALFEIDPEIPLDDDAGYEAWLDITGLDDSFVSSWSESSARAGTSDLFEASLDLFQKAQEAGPDAWIVDESGLDVALFRIGNQVIGSDTRRYRIEADRAVCVQYDPGEGGDLCVGEFDLHDEQWSITQGADASPVP